MTRIRASSPPARATKRSRISPPGSVSSAPPIAISGPREKWRSVAPLSAAGCFPFLDMFNSSNLTDSTHLRCVFLSSRLFTLGIDHGPLTLASQSPDLLVRPPRADGWCAFEVDPERVDSHV